MEQQTWIGRSLNGRYKIDSMLGQGGMSAVYRATDPNLKRVVAVKLIHQHLSTDEEFIYRFKREAAAVAAFRHPNIVQVYDFNNDGEVYYMILEFIPGETLQDHLKHLKNSNTKMPVQQAIKIILNVCDALSYAHKQGMIHRDIKPANIMLDTHGQAILMDFGIVKILDETAHTATGAVLGTARYMSPEVIRSEMPDERSDIYSLGVAFYEMLSGDPPFNADSAMSLLMRHLNDPVPDLNSKRQDLPPELIRIVNKSLEKDRGDRYRSASGMAGDLRRLLTALETESAPTASTSPKTDPAIAETKKSAEKAPKQTEDSTEPWAISTPSVTLEESASRQAPELDQTLPEVVDEEPKQETRKENLKKEVKPVPQSTKPPIMKYGGIGVAAILIVIAGVLGVRSLGNKSSLSASDIASTAGAETVNAGLTNSPLEAAQQTVDAGLTEFPVQPTATSTLSPTPTETLIPPTPTPETPYVLITGIKIENNQYVVDYEVHNFDESTSMHVHMFFNTVPPEQAGLPGSGPWKLTWGPYGDPPFTQYGPANRPAGATQMCSLVANPNHTVILESGNCFDLPE